VKKTELCPHLRVLSLFDEGFTIVWLKEGMGENRGLRVSIYASEIV
jgi:hypothetical protein